MKKHYLLTLIFSSLFIVNFAQVPAKYWVQFSDKSHSSYSIDRPEEFLSPRAIANRTKHHIAIDETDLPVSQYYIDKLKDVDSTVVILTRSKWLNGVTVYAEREDAIKAFTSLPFVTYCEKTSIMKDVIAKEDSIKMYCDYTFGGPELHNTISTFDLNYGRSYEQLKTNNAQWLHRLGFTGTGVHLTVMDGGFDHADTLRFYNTLRQENRILGTRNFVMPGGCVFTDDAHGEMVLSCIASYVPGEIIGTAPNVSVYLAKTEDGRTEYIIEEDNWAAGAEWADSLGCEVLSASLGYFIFDDSSMVRHYSDLNGQVSRASRVATMAVKKGLIVVNSAGNAGMRKDWSKIGFPTEAYDVLSVGAIDVKGRRAPFSSKGPGVNGRIKPDICAVGAQTVIGRTSGIVGTSNGTSFSAPLMAGMVVCLRQAFPSKSNYEIMNAVRKSGSISTEPDTLMGYGVADMLRAYNYLLNNDVKLGSRAIHYFINNCSVDYPTFVSENPNDFVIKFNNPNGIEKGLQISIKSRSTGKTATKTYKLKSGENTLHVKLPQSKAHATYDIMDIDISGTTGLTHFINVIGVELNK